MTKRALGTFIAFIALTLLLTFDILPCVETWRVRAQQQVGIGATRAPSIDVDKKDKLYLALSVATNPPSAGTPGSEVMFMKSPDRGATWNNLPLTKRLTRASGEAFGATIAVTKQGKPRAYITYHDNSSGTTQAFLIPSKKAAKFKKSQNITPHSDGAFFPRPALDSNEGLNIVWGDVATVHRRVVFVRSTDLGATFGDLIDVSQSEGDAFRPNITVDPSDNIHIVWEDSAPGESSIMTSRSTDSGQSFSEPIRVSSEGIPAFEPHIASDREGRLHVAWIGEGENGSNTFYARSVDAGETFSEPVIIGNTSGGTAEKPFVATFRNNIWVAYNDRSRSSSQAFLIRSEDGGSSFSAQRQISAADSSKGRAHSVSMVSDRTGLLHIVWIDSSILGNDEGLLFYTRTSDGRSFEPQKLIIAVVQPGD